jgi:hypothetical protein
MYANIEEDKTQGIFFHMFVHVGMPHQIFKEYTKAL